MIIFATSVVHVILMAEFLPFCTVIGLNICAATVEDTHKLWRNIEPHLRKCLHNVYLREVTGFVHHIVLVVHCFVIIIAVMPYDI